MVQICTPQLGPKNKSIETEIKTGEHRSIDTKFKSSQLTEAIEARVSIRYVIENDEVFAIGAKWANLPKNSRTSYTTTTLALISETIVRPAFDRVSRLKPSIADSLKRTVALNAMTVNLQQRWERQKRKSEVGQKSEGNQ